MQNNIHSMKRTVRTRRSGSVKPSWDAVMGYSWWEYSVIDSAVVLLIFLSMGLLTQHSWFIGSLQLEQDGLTVHGHAVVEVVTTPGFYSNSGRVSEVERNLTDGRIASVL